MRNIPGLLILLLLLVDASAQTNPAAPGGAPPPVVEAQRLLGAGETAKAAALLEPLAGRSAVDPQVRHLLGVIYYRQRNFARAIELLTPTAVARPAEAGGTVPYREAVQLLGFAHYYLNHFKEALPYLEQLRVWARENTELEYVLGVSYIQTRQIAAARAAFARMFQQPPDSAPAHLLNAQMMIRQRFEELAESELRQALTLDPKLPQANFLLGELAIYRAQVDLGIELLRKEIALNPAFGMAYYRLGEAYTRQLKWEEALAPLQKAIWLSPYFSGPYIVLGKVYLKKGELANAEAMLRRAVQMDANNFSAHHLLAQVLQQSNRPAEAKKEFEIAERLRAGDEKGN